MVMLPINVSEDPYGLEWFSLGDGRFMFKGKLATLSRTIIGNSIESLFALARKMDQGKA